VQGQDYVSSWKNEEALIWLKNNFYCSKRAFYQDSCIRIWCHEAFKGAELGDEKYNLGYNRWPF
jgi:hypothetical protein